MIKRAEVNIKGTDTPMAPRLFAVNRTHSHAKRTLSQACCLIVVSMVQPAFFATAEDYLELTKRQTQNVPTSKLIEMARSAPSSFLPMILHQRIESSSASELKQVLGHQFLYGYYYRIFFRLVYVLKAQNPLNEFPTSELIENLNQSTLNSDAYREYSMALNGRLSVLSDSQLKATMMKASPGSNFSKLCYIHVSTREARHSQATAPKRVDPIAKGARATQFFKTSYKPLVINRLDRTYVPPIGYETVPVTIEFSIARDGCLRDAKVIKSPGVPGVDAAALKAVKDASPFPPFPPDSDDEGVTTVYQFNAKYSSESLFSQGR